MYAPSLCLCCVQGAGGLWRVIASQYPCTSSAVWTPGLWTGLGPASSESGPGAWCQTSWQTCSCRSDAGQNGLGRPSETPGSSGDERWREDKERKRECMEESERPTKWIMHHKLVWPFRAYCNYSWVFLFIEGHTAGKLISIQIYKRLMVSLIANTIRV